MVQETVSWWSSTKTSEDFLHALQYLLDNKIITIPTDTVSEGKLED